MAALHPAGSIDDSGWFLRNGWTECEEPAEIDCIWSSHRLLINPIKESQTNAQDWNTPQAQ